jgi:hypothetical protein
VALLVGFVLGFWFCFLRWLRPKTKHRPKKE